MIEPSAISTRSSAEISGENLLTPEQRSIVIAEAQSWVAAHTPYIPHAKIKGAGCDCASFILAVYANVGMVEDVDLGWYSIQAHLHKPLTPEHEQMQRQYLDTILRYADEIPESEALPGDMVLFKTGRAFAHGGIVVETSPLKIIHAAIGLGVVEADVELDPHLKSPRERRFFRRNFSK